MDSMGGMMIDGNQRVVKLTVVACILFYGFSYGTAIVEGAAAQQQSGETRKTSKENAAGKPAESAEGKSPSSLFPIEAFHEIIRQERIAVLKEIDRERKETLDYLTKERVAALLEIDNERKATLDYLSRERGVVVEELRAELNRVIEVLLSERRATMLELEVVGNRLVEGALLDSERLVDHFFIRLLQLLVLIGLVLGVAAVIIYSIMRKHRPIGS
jgi:hypothetical protein